MNWLKNTTLLFKKNNFILIGVFSVIFTVITLESVYATAYTLNSPNKTVTIRWSSLNVEPGSCVATGGYASTWTGVKGDNGFYNFQFPANTFPVGLHTFNFGCTSTATSSQGGAVVSASYDLNVLPGSSVQLLLSTTTTTNPLYTAPTMNFSADTYYVAVGASVILTWNYTDPYGSCVASGAWAGLMGISGTRTIRNYSPGFGNALQYDLTCSSNGTPTASTSINIDFDNNGSGSPGNPAQ